MITLAIETAALVLLAVTGWLVTPSAHGARWRVAVSLPVGVAVHACVMLVLLATRLSIARPWVGLLVALAGAAVLAHRRGELVAPRSPGQGLALATTAAIGVVTLLATAALPLVNVTADSFRYLTVARLLALDGDASGMSAFLLQSRSLVTGAVHGLAAADPSYLRALGPLVAVSTAVSLWLLTREMTARLGPGLGPWVAGGAAALLVTNHRFVFNAFYVNGHLLFAAWVLLLVAIAWRRVAGAVVLGDAVLAVLLATGLTLLRPEGVLVATVVLLPVVLTPSVAPSWRQWVLVGVGAGTVLWHVGVLAPLTLRDGYSPPFAILGLGLLGLVLVVVAGGLGIADRFVGAWTLPMAHVGLWALVLVLAVRDPAILIDSAGATLRNVLGDGAWGASLLVLAGVLVVAVLLRRVEHEQVWLFPLLTFVPLSVLLAFLREGAYRVGPGDSLNRMLLHVLPLAVLAVAVTADGEARPWTRRLASRWSAGDGDEDGGAVLPSAQGLG